MEQLPQDLIRTDHYPSDGDFGFVSPPDSDEEAVEQDAGVPTEPSERALPAWYVPAAENQGAAGIPGTEQDPGEQVPLHVQEREPLPRATPHVDEASPAAIPAASLTNIGRGERTDEGDQSLRQQATAFGKEDHAIRPLISTAQEGATPALTGELITPGQREGGDQHLTEREPELLLKTDDLQGPLLSPFDALAELAVPAQDRAEEPMGPAGALVIDQSQASGRELAHPVTDLTQQAFIPPVRQAATPSTAERIIHRFLPAPRERVDTPARPILQITEVGDLHPGVIDVMAYELERRAAGFADGRYDVDFLLQRIEAIVQSASPTLSRALDVGAVFLPRDSDSERSRQPLPSDKVLPQDVSSIAGAWQQALWSYWRG
jgi:hypothetical protein